MTARQPIGSEVSAQDMFAYQEARPAIGLAPLIDVVFLLLIFFMVATVFVEERVMDMYADEKKGQRADKVTMTFVLDKQGRLFYQEQEYTYQAIVGLVQGRADKPMTVVLESDPMTRVQDSITVVDYLDKAGVGGVRFVLSHSAETKEN
ncbi:MAG: biopolymer transporter ExbD [Alphaproteobacteria bacterium GM202ARS2]|nr:biopolymer transporter ExbD [Alphaproteobacteria bacterium GM202ARS2]